MTKSSRRTKNTKSKDGLWMKIGGRTFLLKSARDVTEQEMIDLGLSPERAPEYLAGIPPGLHEFAVYERRYALPPSDPIPHLTHKKLWQLGRSYADFAAPHLIEQAQTTNYRLPARKVSELFPVLKDIYVLLERDHGLHWDYLLVSQQDDFLTGFWNRLREKGIVEKTISGAR
jgi:hypothetical protein